MTREFVTWMDMNGNRTGTLWCFKCGIYGGGHRFECTYAKGVFMTGFGWRFWRTLG